MATKRKLPARNKKGQFITKGQAKKKLTQIRKGGKPSVMGCSQAGRELKTRGTSSSGSILMKCGANDTYKAYFSKKSAGKVKNRRGFRAKRK